MDALLLLLLMLRLCYWAVFVCKQQRLQVNNFFAKDANLMGEVLVFLTELLNLALKISQPLLLTLTTLECSNPVLHC